MCKMSQKSEIHIPRCLWRLYWFPALSLAAALERLQAGREESGFLLTEFFVSHMLQAVGVQHYDS